MHIKKMIDTIISKKNEEDMERMSEMFASNVYDLKKVNYSLYKDTEYELYTMAYGDNLTEELATKWVGSMDNKDGTVGEHWNREQTDSVLKQYNIKANANDWYAVMNMIYSDYYSPKLDTATYIDLAKDWINDKDVGDGKTLKYYMYVVN